MGRRTEHVPAATEADEKAFDEWMTNWEDQLRAHGGSSIQSLLASHVAWAPDSPVSRHALAAGVVDHVLLEQHRKPLIESRHGRHYGGGGTT